MLPVDFGGVVCVCISLVTFQEVFQMQKWLQMNDHAEPVSVLYEKCALRIFRKQFSFSC